MVIHKIDLAGKLTEPIGADKDATLTFKLLNGNNALNLTGAVVKMYIETGGNVSVVEGTITNKGYVEFTLDFPMGTIATAEIVVAHDGQILSTYVSKIYF